MENQLLKNLYSSTSQLINDHVDRNNEIFDKADKIIIWIVGFSIGVFVLLITRNSNNEIIKDLDFEISLISLSVVILGLLFRIFSFFTQMNLTSIFIDFIAFSNGFTNEKKIPTPREILVTYTLDEIIYFFEQDFDIKIKDLNIKNLTVEQEKDYRELYKNYYESLAESNDVQKQLEEFTSEIAKRFGLKENTITQAMDNEKETERKGIIFQRMLKASHILFFSTISLFVIGIGYLIFKLIQFNFS